MKTKIFTLFALLLLLLNGCSKSEEPAIIYYLVTFESNGGSEIESTTIEEGKYAEKPTDPTNNNYLFGGWYVDEILSVDWDFNSDKITDNITLYAKWIGLNATITNTKVKDIEYNSAKIVFDIVKQPESTDIIEYGVCYSIDEQPTISDNKEMCKHNENSVVISNLPRNNRRYIRAYITDGNNVIYGEEQSFTTLSYPYNTPQYTINIPNVGDYTIFVPTENEKKSDGKTDLLLSNHTFGTNNVLGALNSGGDAIERCKSKGEGWYLPSQKELYYFLEHLDEIGEQLPSGQYWTSTQYDYATAWIGSSPFYGLTSSSKDTIAKVRCFWR